MSRLYAARTLLNAGVAIAALIAPLSIAPAFAQDAPAADEPQVKDYSDGDIVVTARRREERLLDVPVAITAFTGEALEKSGAIDITDLSNVTPNTTFENSRGTNSTLTAFIRGVGQQDPVPGFEAGVGIYLDDVYLNRPQASVLDIYDVDRIEVLRGPQGTLYGRNTIGGAIKYVTKRLPDDFSVKVKGSYGSYQQADGILSASVPIGDMLKIGGSIARLSRGGFGDNLNLGIENYNKDVYAARGTIEFQSPDKRLFVRLTGDFTHDKSNARNGHRLITGLLTGAPVLSNVYDTRAGLNQPRQDVQAGGGSMAITAELTDNVTLRSISAYREDRSNAPIDFDSLPSADVDVPAVYRNNQTSQEFQLLYTSDKLNGIVGAYYLGAEASTAFDVILGTTGPLIGIPGLNAYTAGNVRTETISFYGDFTYDFTDWVSLTLGGRYTNDQRKSRVLKQTKAGGASPQFGGTAVILSTQTDFRGEATYKRFTPRASLSFKPMENLLVYGSFSQGFKGGGFDPRGGGNVAPDTNRDGVRSYQEIYDFLSFDPETVNTYEVGIKGSAFDRRLTFALDGFYSQYKDVQIPGSIGVDANNDGIFESFVGVTTNAAKATLKGIELETMAVLSRDFAGAGSAITLAGTLGYIDGKYDRFIGTTGADISNVRVIQNTPDFTGSATLGAVLPIAGGELSASTTYSYRSETHQFETRSPFLDQPGYGLLDASIVYSFGDDKYSIGVHGKNLTNERYITSGYQFLTTGIDGTPVRTGTGNVVPSLGREGTVTAFYGNPRQVFATFTAKF
ncbi:iron complex outermembrane receptor protein [Sphingomonas sp. UYAg733]